MSLFKISFFVLSAHAALIYWAVHKVPSHPSVKPVQPQLITQTITFGETDTPGERQSLESPIEVVKEKRTKPKAKEPKPEPAETKAEPKAEPTESKPKVKPEPKPPKTEPKPANKEKEKKTETPKKKIIKDPALVEKAKENIAKITKTSDKTTTSEAVVKEKGKSQSAAKAGKESSQETAVATAQEAGYRDELSNRLKLLLRLPEYGMVKVRLTVDRKGQVRKVEIVTAESETNKSYIVEALPELLFPPFGSNFSGESEHTFLISLNNEI